MSDELRDRRLEVSTWTGSVYLLDLPADGAGTLLRVPDPDKGELLRRDGEQLPIYQILQLEVGQAMVVACGVVPNALTIRSTSEVLSIREI